MRRALCAAFALAHAACASRVAITMRTTEGDFRCVVDAEHAPSAASHFLDWASGDAGYVDAETAAVVEAPLYRELAFFRAIPRGYIQSGCQRGDGTTTAGLRFLLEPRPDDADRLSRPGVLALVTYHAPPDRKDPSPPSSGEIVGSQFIVTLGDMRHLAGSVSVVGACGDLDVAARLAARVVAGERPRLVAITRP